MAARPGLLAVFPCFLATLVFVCAASGADGEAYRRNWPQWRGPLGNGLVAHGDPPLVWSETTNLQWKAALPGLGHATPIIWDDRIFVLTAVPTGDGGRLAFSVLCLDRQTGNTLWQRVAREDSPHQDIQPTNSHSSASPVTDGELLIASFGSYGLYCYDFEGRQLWQRDLGKVNVTWGEGSSPALAGDAVIVVQDNNAASYLYAFDKRTGRELWKKPRDEGSSWTTPLVLTRGGRTEVIVNGSKAVRSYDPATGDVLWQCSGLGANVTPMVVVDDRAAYAMSGQRTSPMAMAIALGRSGDLTDTDAVLWKFDRGTPYVASPLLDGGLLYFFQHVTPILTCLDAATGKPHFAQQRLAELEGVYASPIAVGGRIYVPGLSGVTLVLACSPELKILATNKLDDRFAASPVVVGRQLLLRGHKSLYCITEP